MDIIHKNITIKGKVQGVGFRYACLSAARKFGIKGFVRNMPNGDVYIEAEATEVRINTFIKWCHDGPAHARVSSVLSLDGNTTNYTHFDIKH